MKNRITLFIFAMMMLFAADTRAAENAADSKKFYEAAVKAQPGNANAHFDLGNVYLMEKRYEDALIHYEKAGRLGLASSRMDSYYFNLSVCYAGLDRMDDAVKSLEECIRINPRHEEARNLLEAYRYKLSP